MSTQTTSHSPRVVMARFLDHELLMVQLDPQGRLWLSDATGDYPVTRADLQALLDAYPDGAE